jgi:hypothetical protein
MPEAAGPAGRCRLARSGFFGHTDPMNDRDVYLKLSEVAEELARLAPTAESHVGQAALSTAAQTLAGTAKVIYDHVLGGDEH